MSILSSFKGAGLIILVSYISAFAQEKLKTAASRPDMGKAQWLIGTWVSNTARGSIFETWTKVTDKEFWGKSYSIKEKDTLVFETVRLIEKQGSLFYIPTVKNQNKGDAVTFKSRSVSPPEMIFENLGHDFPQQIIYTRISEDSLRAVISGTVNGKMKSQKFSMRKLKN